MTDPNWDNESWQPLLCILWKLLFSCSHASSVSGRNKIQDTWCSIPYKVVIYFGDTCVIYTAGGQIRPVQECDKEEDPGHQRKSGFKWNSKTFNKRSTVTYLQCYRQVDQVEVYVVQLQFLQTHLNGPPDLLWFHMNQSKL